MRLDSSSEEEKDDDDDDEEEEEETDAALSYGGVVRSIVRNAVKKSLSPSLNLVPRPKIVAKSAGNISDLLDLKDHLVNANETIANDKKGFKPLLLLKQALPQFVKSSIQGTIVFSCYQSCYQYCYEYGPIGPSIGPPSSISLSSTIFPSIFLNSFGCGFMSGALCGIFTTTWDLVAQTTRNTGGIGGIGGGTVMQVAKRLFVLATTTSGRRGNSLWIVPLVTGGLVNGAMFSTYEVTKHGFGVTHAMAEFEEKKLQRDKDKDSDLDKKSDIKSNPLDKKSDPKSDLKSDIRLATELFSDILLLYTAGSLAGASAEVMIHYLEPVEKFKFQKGLKANYTLLVRSMKRLPFPSICTLTFASFPYAVGFLAYEMGKET